MKRIVMIVLSLLIPLNVYCQAEEFDNKLVLGTVDDFPPFFYKVDGKLTGIDIDVLNEAAKRIGVAIKIKAYPWKRVMKLVEKGTIDGGFAAFKTKEREEFCLYAEILHFEEFQLFVRKGNELRYSDISELYGKTIGKDRWVFVGDEFEKTAKEGEIRLEEISDLNIPNMRKLLNAGRLDAAIGDLGVMMYYFKSLGMEKDIVPIGPVGKKKGAYLILSKVSSLRDKIGLQNKFRAVLQQIKEDGTYQGIFERHTK
ncbi:MAG: amino acid ABC transporter substrate-binding protein [Desulfobacter sp.]|nr:MAG: amino acid ABC transporter substrate-binding protein [Desulfobacter sp.]